MLKFSDRASEIAAKDLPRVTSVLPLTQRGDCRCAIISTLANIFHHQNNIKIMSSYCGVSEYIPLI